MIPSNGASELGTRDLVSRECQLGFNLFELRRNDDHRRPVLRRKRLPMLAQRLLALRIQP